MDLVEKILQEESEKESHFKTTEVPKAIDVEIDEGNLLALDPNPLEIQKFRQNKEKFLQNLSRDNTQILLNKLFQLPTEQVDGIVIAQLGDPTTPIPREKRVPKLKPLTKWEQYAKLKGIQNRKKSRMMWDEKSSDWRPRWGYKRGNDDKDWMLEVPDNADPYQDQFEKKKKDKSERVAKNEYQRLKNIARAQKVKFPNIGVTPTENPSKFEVSKALTVTKTSTASLGKFDEALPKEKRTRSSVKRKFADNYGDVKKESDNQLKILNRITSKQAIVDVSKAPAMQHTGKSKRTESSSYGKPKKTFKPKGKGGHGNFGGKGGKGGRGKKPGGKKGKS